VSAVLGETFRLLAAHLHLFTLIALTVWLPGHVLRNYLEFFGPPGGSAVLSLQLVLAIQVIFDPLVVSATLRALNRIQQGLPVDYATAMSEGLAAWGRLFFVRGIINCAVVLPAVGGLAIDPSGSRGLLAGSLLLAVAVLILVALLRYAVVDSVVVLEGGNAVTAWRRAAQLTAGQRWAILWTATVLLLLIFTSAMLVAQLFKAVPELNHFVVRVLVDCALAVGQSSFTIALFLYYRRAQAAAA
jgi:hypothetical protein